MTREEAGKLVALLFSTYPNTNVERRHVDAYVSGIVDLNADSAGQAAEKLRLSSKFLPAVSEIREAAAAIEHSKQAAVARLRESRRPSLSMAQLAKRDVAIVKPKVKR